MCQWPNIPAGFVFSPEIDCLGLCECVCSFCWFCSLPVFVWCVDCTRLWYTVVCKLVGSLFDYCSSHSKFRILRPLAGLPRAKHAELGTGANYLQARYFKLEVLQPHKNSVTCRANNMSMEVTAKSPNIPPTKWCVPIPFEVQHVPDGPFVQTNLCNLMSSDRRNQVYRFDPTVYPPAIDKEAPTDGKTKLIRQLQLEAQTASQLSLISTGGKRHTDKSGATFCFALVCSCSLVYQSSGEKLDDGTARYKSKVDKESGTVINQDVKVVSIHGN
jgi:hypothetical protein